MLNTKQRETTQVTECIIRVRDGNLAPGGKGTFTMVEMPDGKVILSATLPSECGVPEPFDLMSLERLELVKTRPGWYQGNQWIQPTAALLGAFVGPAIILSILIPPAPPALSIGGAFGALAEMALYASMTAGCSVFALTYAGFKLPRIARFVAVTHDGRYCVAEMPEVAFRFLQGINTAMNLNIQTDIAAVSASEVLETAPAPA
jgi:hypothetical protein